MKPFFIAIFLTACGGPHVGEPADLGSSTDAAAPSLDLSSQRVPDLASPDLAQPDPCEGIVCDAPPAPSCSDGVTLSTPYGTGVCIDGQCVYDASSSPCPYGCSSGACEPRCVDGLQQACTTSGLDWNGTQCCSTIAPFQCVAGDATSCTGTDLYWTGTLCCAEKVSCVDGTAGACPTIGVWTGSLCCTGYAAGVCMSGDFTEAQCANSNGAWTGAQCCIP